MPTISKKQLKTTPPRISNPFSSAIPSKYCYGSPTWKHLRLSKLIECPLCERCKEEGKITPATDVHHKITWQDKGQEWRTYAFDYENLMSLCEECHYAIHNELNSKKKETQ